MFADLLGEVLVDLVSFPQTRVLRIGLSSAALNCPNYSICGAKSRGRVTGIPDCPAPSA